MSVDPLLIKIPEMLIDERVVVRSADPRHGFQFAVAKRAGFINEGTLRCNALDTNGNLRGTSVFALTRDDFAKLSVK